MTDTDIKKWYVVRAVSGQENKIRSYMESEINRLYKIMKIYFKVYKIEIILLKIKNIVYKEVR